MCLLGLWGGTVVLPLWSTPMGTQLSVVLQWQPPAPGVLCPLEILLCAEAPGLGGESTLQMGDGALEVRH